MTKKKEAFTLYYITSTSTKAKVEQVYVSSFWPTTSISPGSVQQPECY